MGETSCRPNRLRKQVTEATGRPWSLGESGRENAPGEGVGEAWTCSRERVAHVFIFVMKVQVYWPFTSRQREHES